MKVSQPDQGGFSAVLFDIGDTLLDARGVRRESLQSAAQQLVAGGFTSDASAFLSAYEDADQEISAADINQLYSDLRIADRAFQILGRQADTRATGFFLTVYRNAVRRNLHVDTQLIATLDELTAAGVKLGIVSNGTTVEQLEQLVCLGVIKYFEPILISQQIGIAKPDKRIFQRASELLRIEPERFLVVGDRPDWEVLGAHRAGMKAALMTRYIDNRAKIIEPAMRPEYVIDNVNDLLKIVQIGRSHNGSQSKYQ